MEIRHLIRAHPADIAAQLIKERDRRIQSSQRNAFPDFAYVYESMETFSLRRDEDMAFIREPLEFWNYVFGRGIRIVRIARGGGIMWHGTGQVMLSPLIDLARAHFGISDYAHILEKTCIKTLAHWNIEGFLNPYCNGAQGVWVFHEGTKKKIAFRGAHVANGIVIHGCALNVRPDLYPFSLIHPCNLASVEAASMQARLNENCPSVSDVMQIVGETFARIFREQGEK